MPPILSRVLVVWWMAPGVAVGAVAACGGAGSSQEGAGGPDTGPANGGGDATGADGGLPEARGGLDSPVAANEASSPEASGNAHTSDASSASDAPESGPASWTCPPGTFGSPMASAATPTRIAGMPPRDAFNNTNNNFGIIESPVWIADALYVSEIGQSTSGTTPPPSRILQVTSAGTVSVAVADSGSNGLAVDKSGNLYGAVHKDGSISRFDLSTGIATPVASLYMGARFNSPNDLAIRDDGNIYFSDPDYQAPSPRPQPQTRVYRVAPDGTVTVVDATLSEPNGVALSLDQNTLYVGSTSGIYAYPLAADGSAGGGRVFSQGTNADGLSIDCAGNLYVAASNSSSVVVLGPTGTPIGTPIAVTGVQSVTMANFGGLDHKTLYIAALGSGAQKGLFQVGFSVPGAGR